jgi:integrase
MLYVSHSKTPEGEAREIPLSDRLLALLSEMRKDSGLIFTYAGKPIHKIKTAWMAAIRRSGIRYIRFHYLRHTFNTRLLELGVTREVRMALLGHTFGDTHESYEHVEMPLKREAIRKLDAWLKEEITKKEEGGGGTNGSQGVRSDCPGDPREGDSGSREISSDG